IQGGKGALQEAIFMHGRLVIALLLIDQPALELVDADQKFFAQGIEKSEPLLLSLLDALQVDVVVQLGLGEIKQGFKTAGGEVQLLGDGRAAEQGIAGKLASVQAETLFGMKAAKVSQALELALADVHPAVEARFPEAHLPFEDGI